MCVTPNFSVVEFTDGLSYRSVLYNSRFLGKFVGDAYCIRIFGGAAPHECSQELKNFDS
jgi:hypothetical protein